MSRIRMVLLRHRYSPSSLSCGRAPRSGRQTRSPGHGWRQIPSDGSALKLQIGEANASGVRHVTLMDQNQFHSGCGGLATGIGSGTVSGTTLSATLEHQVRGITERDGRSVHLRRRRRHARRPRGRRLGDGPPGRQTAFTGAGAGDRSQRRKRAEASDRRGEGVRGRTARDADGSESDPSRATVRRRLGSSQRTASGPALSAALDVRCGGSLSATDAPFPSTPLGDERYVGLDVVWRQSRRLNRARCSSP